MVVSGKNINHGAKESAGSIRARQKGQKEYIDE